MDKRPIGGAAVTSPLDCDHYQTKDLQKASLSEKFTQRYRCRLLRVFDMQAKLSLASSY